MPPKTGETLQGLTIEQITNLLAEQNEPPKQRQADLFTIHGFDPAAVFLLELQWENMFEPWNAAPGDPLYFRCKGCRRMVNRERRQNHYETHKRDYES